MDRDTAQTMLENLPSNTYAHIGTRCVWWNYWMRTVKTWYVDTIPHYTTYGSIEDVLAVVLDK